MKKLNHILSFILFLVVMSSCSENRFTNVLEIEIPTEESVLAVTTHIQPGDRIIQTLVSHTMGTLVDSTFSSMPDATVQLFENGSMIGNFEYESFAEKHINTLDFPIKDEPGTTYRMEVSADGYTSVSAEQVMPKEVSILNAEYTPRGGIDFEGYEVDELFVEFQDLDGEENFYKFRVMVNIEFRYEGDTTVQQITDMLYLDTLDPLIEYGADDNLLLNDRSFEGDTYKARLFFYPLDNWIFGDEFEIIKNQLIVEVGNITNDKYLYLKTLDSYRENKDNPFSEPVTVHHNFENGTGIFTLENTSTYILNL